MYCRTMPQRAPSSGMGLTLSDRQIKAWAKLTKRQRACIDAILRGHFSDKAIAQVLGLKAYTVADHLKQARWKLGLRSRTALALTALLLTLREGSSAVRVEAINGVASEGALGGGRPQAGD